MYLLPAKTPPHIDEFTNRVTCGDALATLQRMPSESVHCIVTSPPYFGLRDYGVDGQIGLEETPRQYVEKLTALFREARRILKADGTLWLNLGDSFSGGGNYRGVHSLDTLSSKQRSNGGSTGISQLLGAKNTGIADKNLLLIPARVAISLQDDGWIVRSDIIWSKPNPMPESVTDRPTKAHEYVFLMSKNARYWYDADAIREPHKPESLERYKYGAGKLTSPDDGFVSVGARNARSLANAETLADNVNPDGRNKRSVWTIATQPTPEAHFATFPEKLIEPMILAGCPVGGIVLDPFFGSGTTGLVARRLGRKFAGIELNPAYVAISERRLSVPYTLPMFESLALEA